MSSRLVWRAMVILPDVWPFSALSSKFGLVREWEVEGYDPPVWLDYEPAPPKTDAEIEEEENRRRLEVAEMCFEMGHPVMNRGDIIGQAMKHALDQKRDDSVIDESHAFAAGVEAEYEKGLAQNLQTQILVEPFVMLGPNAYPNKNDIDYKVSTEVFEFSRNGGKEGE